MYSLKEEIKRIKKRNQVLKTFESIVGNEGFIRVESDYFEDYEDFISQNTRQDKKRLVKVNDLKGNIKVLQADITSNIIKQVIPRIPQGFTESFYYIDNIFTFNSAGDIENTRQFGVEVFGKKDIKDDIQLIQLIMSLMEQIGVEVVLEIGNQKWIDTVISLLHLPRNQIDRLKEALIAKNKRDIRILLQDYPPYKDLLITVLENQNNIGAVKDYINQERLDPQLLNELNKLENMKQRIPNTNVIIDLSLINPFDYYNGPVFKGYIKGYPTDIIRGGRYDYLTKEYGVLTPALGFSMDIDHIIKKVK
jgi:ATP phosphoribosyltransferase regulatory subunit